jgi:hypothetical protein
MSSDMGMVVFKDNTILYGIYHGTTDIMANNLSETWNGAWEIKSYKDPCSCEGEDVLIYSYYGSGATYTGKACKKHKCIIFDFNNFLETEYAYKDLWQNKSKYSVEEIEQKNLRYNNILTGNWRKSGNHTGIDIKD